MEKMGLAPKSLVGLRVGVIGLGRMGVRHIEAARNLGMTICGAADTSEQTLEAVRLSQNISPSACFADANDMLRTVRPDAVVVATTADSHFALVVAAAECGSAYILCEKPMATSLAEADAMREACERAGALLAVNHQMQFMPHYMRVKAMIGSDELGPLVSVLVAGSNFGLAMNASHYFEMFRYISGGNVRSVRAWLEKDRLSNPRGSQFEDSSGRLLVRGTDDTAMYVDFCAGAGYGLQIVFICRQGQIVMDELNGEIRVASRKPEFRDLPTARYGMPADVRVEGVGPTDAVSPTMGVWSAMLAGEPFPDGGVGTQALACCVAAHVSHEKEGCEVLLDHSSLPRSRVFKWA
jgi:predicted dehydrogenase